MDSIQIALVYTYADLRRVHTERLQDEHKSSQQIYNHMSALSQFASVLGKSDASACEQDFAEHFDQNLTAFAESLTARGISDAVIANRISYLRAFKLTYHAMITGTIGSGSFRECLVALLQAHGITQAHLGREAGVDDSKINNWVKGMIPRKSSANDIMKIEGYFGLPRGALLNKIDIRLGQPEPPELERRKMLSALQQDRYVYKEPTERIRTEWKELFTFHTAPYITNGLQRNSTWRMKPAERVTCLQLMGWESVTPNGVCVTAHINWRNLAAFFGYLIRDESLGGKGMQESQLSLAVASDSALVLEYIEFRKARSGVYTGEIRRTLGFISFLLRKESGFLWQHPKYGERLPTPIAKEEWRNWCETNRATLTSVYSSLKKGKHFQKGRDPKEPIAKILAEQHPIRVLLKMVESMEKKFLLAQHALLRAVHKRNTLLIKMLLSNPLRVHHYSIMSYTKDNNGNLYQDAQGAWHLRFQPADFKNQQGAASKEYDVMLPSWLYADIEEYLGTYRAKLAQPESTDRVFIRSQWGHGKRVYIDADEISACVRKASKTFIPSCPGFGAHAFRHIVATDYIKNNPNGFQIAANILHDQLTTVMKEYAHVKVADGFSHWTSYLENQIEASGKADNE